MRRAQILLQRALVAQLLVHRHARRSGSSRALPIWRGYKRGIRIGDQRRRVGAVLRENGDADGQADAQRQAVDFDIGIERRAELLGQRLGGRRLRPGRRDDVEFVAAEAGEKCALAGLLQPARDLAQQRVADRVAEHVVDRLEAVEVDAKQGEAFARSPPRGRAWRRCIR